MASELITVPANTWQRVGGKSGGTVSAIVAAPGSSAERVLYAGTMSGVYTSTDNGRTWSVSNEGLQSPFIQNLAIALEPGSSPRLFAAAAGVGGFMSFGGVNWRRLGFWGVKPEIAAIAASPDFARDRAALTATLTDGVFRTDNAAKTWNAANAGLPQDEDGGEVLAIAYSPDFASDQRAYCAVAGHGLFRSSDGGRNWIAAGIEGEDAPSNIQVIACAPVGRTGAALFLGDEERGVWYSHDGGRCLARSTGVEDESINALAVSPRFASDSTVYAGAGNGTVYRSQDAGESFQKLADPADSAPILALLALAEPGGKTLLLAGTYGAGLARSDDDGQTWSDSAAGIPSQNWLSFAMVPDFGTRPVMFAGGSQGGLFRSSDGGRAWSEAAPGTEGIPVFQIAASPLFAADGRAFAATAVGLFATADGGDSWHRSDQVEECELRCVAVSGANDGNFAVFAGGIEGKAWLSRDNGAELARVDHDFRGDTVLDVQFSPEFAADEIIVVATYGVGRVVVSLSENAGTSWSRVVRHRTHAEWASVAIPDDFDAVERRSWSFAAHNQVFTPARRFRNVWSGSRPAHKNTSVLDLAIAPGYADEPLLFAATSSGVRRSGDGGGTWHAINEGLANRSVLQVALSPDFKNDRMVYILAIGGEVWSYRDDPATLKFEAPDQTELIYRPDGIG